MASTFRQIAVKRAREIKASKPIFLDTETTGLHKMSEIVEICLVDSEETILLETLVKPLVQIPAEATRLHGITNDMVANAPSWIEVWSKVEEIMRGRIVGIYNADFDLRMMRQSHRLAGLPWRQPNSRLFCIMKLYADFYGSSRWMKLEHAGQQCGISLPNTHRARDDTLLAREIFEYMVHFGSE